MVDGLNRMQHQAAIRELHSALDALPHTPLHSVSREHLTSQISGHKKAIIKLRPVGGQLDGCRTAIERAQRRRTDAVTALEEARVKIETSDAEISALQRRSSRHSKCQSQ